MYPPLFFSSQSVYCYSLLLLCQQSPFLPSLSPSSCSMIIISTLLLRCELMITVTNSIFVYKLPLWFRHQCYCNCVLLWFVELFSLCWISAPQVHSCLSHMMTPQWPSAAFSLVVRWPSRESCTSTIVQVCALVVRKRWVGGGAARPASVIYIQYTETAYSSTCIVLLCSNPLPFSCCFLGQSCMWCATDICFCNDVILACSVTQSCRVSTRICFFLAEVVSQLSPISWSSRLVISLVCGWRPKHI